MTKFVLSLAAFVVAFTGFVSNAFAARTVTVVRCSQAPVETWGNPGAVGGYTVRVYHNENNSKKLYANVKLVAPQGNFPIFEGVVTAFPNGFDKSSMTYTALNLSLTVTRGAYGLGAGDLSLGGGSWNTWGTGTSGTQPQDPWNGVTNPQDPWGAQTTKLNCRWGR